MKQFLKEWGVIVLIGIGLISFVTWLIIDTVKFNRTGNEVKNYCGKVMDKGYDSPSSGHKSHTDAQYWIIFRDEDCGKAIRVHLSPGAWYDATMNQRTCFSLSAFELQWYGNTNEPKHLK